MLLRIEGTDLPGRAYAPAPHGPRHDNIHVAVQRRNRPDQPIGLHPGNARTAHWELQATPVPAGDGWDLHGPCLQGRPGARFIYLTWGNLDGQTFTMFRRAKLLLDAVAPDTLAAAADRGLLVGRLPLTDRHGAPLCAAVRPPLIRWTAPADPLSPPEPEPPARAGSENSPTAQ